MKGSERLLRYGRVGGALLLIAAVGFFGFHLHSFDEHHHGAVSCPLAGWTPPVQAFVLLAALLWSGFAYRFSESALFLRFLFASVPSRSPPV